MFLKMTDLATNAFHSVNLLPNLTKRSFLEVKFILQIHIKKKNYQSTSNCCIIIFSTFARIKKKNSSKLSVIFMLCNFTHDDIKWLPRVGGAGRVRRYLTLT